MIVIQTQDYQVERMIKGIYRKLDGARLAANLIGWVGRASAAIGSAARSGRAAVHHSGCRASFLVATAFFCSAAIAEHLRVLPDPPPHPRTVMFDLDGTQRSLEDFRGRVVLLNFWASWCPPCMRELPALQDLARTMDHRSFAVVAVNIGEPKREVRKTLRWLGYEGLVLLDPDLEAHRAWGIEVLPTSVLIDAAGDVRILTVGQIDWQGEIVRKHIEGLIREASERRPVARGLP